MSRIDRLLDQMEQPSSFADAWARLLQGPLDLGDKVTAVTCAVLPRVVALAERQDPKKLARFWSDIAVIVANLNYNTAPASIPANVDDAFRAALVRAETLALDCFGAAEWGNSASDLALACLALTHHPVGCLVWQGPHPPREGYGGDLGRFFCPQCGAEDIVFAIVGDGVAALPDFETTLRVPDLDQPGIEAPPVPDLSAFQRPGHPWGGIAAALDQPAAELRTLCNRTPFPGHFLGRFGEHLAVAVAVAKAGVPKETPNRAALSLLGGMVALSGAFDWAGRLLRLAGYVRCPECGNVDAWANCLENIG